MAETYFMGIDFGTQGVRCGISDENGDFAALSERKYNTNYPAPGRAEQSPHDWISCMERSIEDCFNAAGEKVFSKVNGISVCATASTVVPVDRYDQPIHDAIMWMDVRAVEQTDLINKTRHKVLKYCGNEVSVEWLVPKMMWIKENTPEVFDKAELIVEQLDYVNHYLTGRWCSSVSQATCKGNYVEHLGGYNRDYFETIGFPEFWDKAVTDVLKQGEEVGKLKGVLCEKYRLPDTVKVYQGGIDAHVNVIGLGVCKPGETGIVMGSSFVHLALTERIMFEKGIWGPYKDAVVPEMYCLEGGQISAGSITKWFIKEFDIKGDDPYQIIANEADSVPPGSEGVILLDYFQGNRTPYKDPLARGVFFGLTLSHTKSHMYRAILEGVAFGTRNILEAMESGYDNIRELRGCGGVTKNPVWLRIISDVTDKPIVLTEQSSNAGTLGCAIIAAVGSGYYNSFCDACDKMVHITEVITPDPQTKEIYNQTYLKYLKLYDNLKHIMKE